MNWRLYDENGRFWWETKYHHLIYYMVYGWFQACFYGSMINRLVN